MGQDDAGHELFVTEFPRGRYGIVDYLQGRVHFALLDQMRLMSSSGMKKDEIRRTVLASVTEIVDGFDASKDPAAHP